MNWKFWQTSGRKSKTREWIDAILFAVIAATIIRTFFIEAFTIPTPSMERTLMVGDFLFVSKVNYGARTPMTPLSFPFVHQELPIIGGKSYSDAWKLPYYRLPGFAKVEHNDIVVFNYPMEDDRPIDKQTHYIKRCVGLPGDTIKIIDRTVYINGEMIMKPKGSQYAYGVKTQGYGIRPEALKEIGINDVQQIGVDEYQMMLTQENVKELGKIQTIAEVKPFVQQAGIYENYIYPYNSNLPWNLDNFGALFIPKKGATINLTPDNLTIYKRAITVYEANELVEKNGKIFINGVETSTYTFKQDYFFMMGDNRHNSADSRFWGFVPEDHIVGKAVFIWMSWDTNGSFLTKIRWKRLFNLIHWNNN